METRYTPTEPLNEMLQVYKRLTGLQETLESQCRGLLEPVDDGVDRVLAKARRDDLVVQCRATIAGIRQARQDSRRLLALV